jgi:hypothetical protein
MRLSRHARWSLLGSILVALAAGMLAGSKGWASHFGDARYPANGFENIGGGGSITYHIQATATYPQIARNAQAAWNVTRAQGYVNYADETFTRENWQQVQWNHAGPCPPEVCGTYIYRGTQGNCNLNPGPQRYCYSLELEPLEMGATVGAHIHELGHGMFGLADHFDGDCATIMSGCWFYLTSPTPSDVTAAHRFYGIPDNPSLFLDWSGGATDFICWNDNSTAEWQYWVGVWRDTGSGWQFHHWHYLSRTPGETAGEGWTCFSEDLRAEVGPGYYLYSLYANNAFSGAPGGLQFGGFSNAGAQ